MIRPRPSTNPARGLGRRALLVGAGGVCVGLPFLGGRSHAADATVPKRIVFLVSDNGTNPEAHWPTGSEHDFSLGQIMQPLEPWADRLIVARGVDNQAAMATGINGHTDAVRCMFTGRIAANFDNVDYTAAGGISIDQFIANRVGQDTMFPSLEFLYGYGYTNFTSFYDANQPVPFELEPQALWDRVFAGVEAPDEPDPALLELKADRKSVLDAVADQYATVSGRLGSVDRQRLDLHLEMVRDLERRITESGVSSACVVPERPTGYDDTVGMDLIAYALSCDLTRVATIGWSEVGEGFPGVNGSYHDDYLHLVYDSADAQAIVNSVKTWQCEQIAYFVDKLASIPEGDGTVLDNTLIVWADEFCHGYSHEHREVPYVLVSGSDTFFSMGRYLEFASPRSNNELWIALAHAFGIDEPFGDPQFGDAPLPGLV